MKGFGVFGGLGFLGIWGFGFKDGGFWDQNIGFAGRVDKSHVTYLPRMYYPVISCDC